MSHHASRNNVCHLLCGRGNSQRRRYQNIELLNTKLPKPQSVVGIRLNPVWLSSFDNEIAQVKYYLMISTPRECDHRKGCTNAGVHDQSDLLRIY